MTTITADIILDSVSPEGHRLTTFKLRYPRYIHDQLLTHRVFSRNASSHRAIPVKKMIEDVRRDPVYPIHWGKNQPGMDASEELSEVELRVAEHAWKGGLDAALSTAGWLAEIGAHKQYVNRVLMPYAHVNVLVTATEFMNFFGLRLHPAQPEVMRLAQLMWEAYRASEPWALQPGEWHLPFVGHYDGPAPRNDLIKMSVARCARVSRQSFTTGRDSTLEEDLRTYNDLVTSLPVHASPAEHQATPDSTCPECPDCGASSRWLSPEEHGNLTGWRQYRKMIPGENVAPLPENYR